MKDTISMDQLIDQVAPYTMTRRKKIEFLVWAVEKVSSVDGALVECGVWKGGNLLLMSELSDKSVWGYDTFNGMPKPSTYDRYKGKPAKWREGWCYAELNEVRNLVPNAHLVMGNVKDTIPDQMPEAISLLRLDMDFYHPTKHALNHLYPLVQKGGIVISDDYGVWSGDKKAFDEYRLTIHQIPGTAAYWTIK